MTESTTDTGKKKLSRKKRPARKREEFTSYIIEISDARTSYSFSVNKNKKLDPGPYREIAFLECTGTLIYPEKFAGTTIECTVSGDRRHIDYVEQPLTYDDYCPNLVGLLNIRKDSTNYFSWVPFDVWPHICQMFHLGGLKYFNLYGSALLRNKSNIHSMHFQKTFNPEEDV